MQKTTQTSAILTALQNDDLELVEYINQLERHFNAQEPAVLAFLPEEGRFERLRAEAQALAAQYPDPASRPELYGLLIGVKDIFHVDGFTTRAGSKVPPEILQGQQAESVTRLKQAGALVMGKTVTTEFAYFAPGPTRNPHNPEHTPGGSSSGSAAAVAAGLVPLAFGTQTIGSVTRPASFCGVPGYKPSYDRIPKDGVIPLSASLDHVGLFAAELDLAELAARHLVDEWKAPGELKESPILGVPVGPYLDKAGAEMAAHFEALLHKLERAGHAVKSVEALGDIEAVIERHNLIVAAEAALTHKEWFAKYNDRYHPKTAELIQRGGKVEAAALEDALQGRLQLRSELAALMGSEDIDLWLSPAAPGPAPKGLESTGDPVMNLPWTHSGLPTLNLPSGFNSEGLPLGLQLAAGWYQDEALFVYGKQLEKVVN